MLKDSEICKSCRSCKIKSPLFSLLSEDELDMLNKDRFEVQYKPGELVFKEGSSASYVLSITSGIAKIVKENKTKSLIIRLSRLYELLGAPAIFGTGRYVYSVVALTDIKVCYVDIEPLRSILKTSSGFNYRFMESILQETNLIYTRMESLLLRQSAGKLADCLLFLAGMYCSDPDLINLSRGDLAAAANINRENMNKFLNEFENDGLIQVENGGIRLINQTGLERVAMVG